MKRGDVVRTHAEWLALPIGSELISVDGKKLYRAEAGFLMDENLPALVQVVGPVEPEWLEAAARAAREAHGQPQWPGGEKFAREAYQRLAKAAVAAADKARGIVNSREEFDALPVGHRLVGKSERGGWVDWTIGLDDDAPGELLYPALVISPR